MHGIFFGLKYFLCVYVHTCQTIIPYQVYIDTCLVPIVCFEISKHFLQNPRIRHTFLNETKALHCRSSRNWRCFWKLSRVEHCCLSTWRSEYIPQVDSEHGGWHRRGQLYHLSAMWDPWQPAGWHLLDTCNLGRIFL